MASSYDIVMPTPLAPPPGEWCMYVVTVRLASTAEGGWPGGSGGVERDYVLGFNDTGGTPDTRLYANSGGGRIGSSNFAGSAFSSNPQVDSSGVLTVTILNDNPAGPTDGKYAVTVAGPFVHPEMVTPNPA